MPTPTLPLCGDPEAHWMLERALSFSYPPGAFSADYEAARLRTPPTSTASSEAAADIEAALCARHGRLLGLLRAVRMQAVVVALATRWKQLRMENLVRSGEPEIAENRRVLPIHRVDPAFLAGLLQARVRLPGAPLTGPRLAHEDVDAAIARAVRLRNGP